MNPENENPEEIVKTSIRIPRDLWKALRRAQEDGKIKSIQQAAIDGMAMLIGYEDRGNKEDAGD